MTWTTTDPDQIDLAWESGDAGSQTRVYLDGSVEATKSAGVTTHSITGLESNTAYEVGLRHLENGIFNPLESAAAVTINVTTATGTLGVPQSLAVAPVDPYAVKLTWAVGSPGPAGTYYLLERSDTDVWGGEETTIYTSGPGELTYTHSDIDEATNTWYFRVTAKRTNWNDSTPTSSVSQDYGADAAITAANLLVTDVECIGGTPDCGTASGCTNTGTRHLVRWSHSGGEDAEHHIRIMRADNGGAYAEVVDDLSVNETPECGDMGSYNGGYAFFWALCDDELTSNKYQYKVILEDDGGDVEVDSAETANLKQVGSTACTQ
jgi:hypothetical protein